MADEGGSCSPITSPGQVCYERIIPQEAHYYKTRKTPTDTGDPVCPLPLDAVSFTSKLWRKLDLKVYFLRPHPQQSEILQWAAEWSRHCAVLFYHTTQAGNSDIRVDFNEGQGSWSYLGTDASRVPRESFTMNLGSVDRSTVLHEFGHSLGLIHEHQSPFPGGFEWNRDNVIRDLSGPPNYWDMDRIENNMFRRYKRSDLDGSLYDSHSIMHYSFPREWIKGDGYPTGIDRNTELSPRDKEHVRRLYGPPRISPGEKSTPPVIPQQPAKRPTPGGRTTTVVPVYPTMPAERSKPVTSLPPPRTDKIYDIHVYEPNKGELSGSGAELLVRFHTSSEDRARYTIQTLGDTDMIVALLGPDDYTNVITVNDDGAGDGRNALIVERLMPDRDYYVQFQTFHSQGGKFEFVISAW
jgi:hypothetical protein